jgi:hypothetical protein
MKAKSQCKVELPYFCPVSIDSSASWLTIVHRMYIASNRRRAAVENSWRQAANRLDVLRLRVDSDGANAVWFWFGNFKHL